MDIYSTKRSEVGAEITKYLNEKLKGEYGIEVQSALIIDVQLDEDVYKRQMLFSVALEARFHIKFRIERIEVFAVQMILNDSETFTESLIMNNLTFP